MKVEKTITTIFILPSLEIPREELIANGFINAFIKDELNDNKYENCIYLLFKPKNFDKFRLFLDKEQERTNSIVEDYDYENGFIIVVYKLDLDYEEDYELIKQGKYSKTSKKFQNLFPRALKLKINGLQRDEISLQVRVFRKTTDLREFWEEKLGVNFSDDLEVWEGWNEEKEILNTNIIKQYVQSANT